MGGCWSTKGIGAPTPWHRRDLSSPTQDGAAPEPAGSRCRSLSLRAGCRRLPTRAREPNMPGVPQTIAGQVRERPSFCTCPSGYAGNAHGTGSGPQAARQSVCRPRRDWPPESRLRREPSSVRAGEGSESSVIARPPIGQLLRTAKTGRNRPSKRPTIACRHATWPVDFEECQPHQTAQVNSPARGQGTQSSRAALPWRVSEWLAA